MIETAIFVGTIAIAAVATVVGSIGIAWCTCTIVNKAFPLRLDD